jgi:hypothetical protein
MVKAHKGVECHLTGVPVIGLRHTEHAKFLSAAVFLLFSASNRSGTNCRKPHAYLIVLKRRKHTPALIGINYSISVTADEKSNTRTPIMSAAHPVFGVAELLKRY